MTTGHGYDLLKAAMERLAETQISTNITTGGKEVFETFGLIKSAPWNAVSKSWRASIAATSANGPSA